MNANPNLNNRIPPITPSLVRLEAVRLGLVDGKPLREIARELKCDEGTVRRDHKKLCLPTEMFNRLVAGENYESLLREQERIAKEEERARVAAEKAQRRTLQLVKEQSSGTLSDALKESIIAFFGMFNLLPQDIVAVITFVEKRCWFEGDLEESIRADDHLIAMAITKPDKLPVDTVYLVNDLRVWLFLWLNRAENLRDIRDRGIVKARRHYEPQCRM